MSKRKVTWSNGAFHRKLHWPLCVSSTFNRLLGLGGWPVGHGLVSCRTRLNLIIPITPSLVTTARQEKPICFCLPGRVGQIPTFCWVHFPHPPFIHVQEGGHTLTNLDDFATSIYYLLDMTMVGRCDSLVIQHGCPMLGAGTFQCFQFTLLSDPITCQILCINWHKLLSWKRKEQMKGKQFLGAVPM